MTRRAILSFASLSLLVPLSPSGAHPRFQDSPAPASPPAPAAAEPEDTEPRGLRHREEGAFEGYTLLAPLNSKSIHLVDMDGEVVHTWTTEHAPGAATYFLDSGHLLRCGRQDSNPRFHGGGIGGRIQELDWDGKVVWDFELASAELTQHHDVEPMPNGNLLVIAWEHHSREEAAERGRAREWQHEEGLWSDVVLEIRPKRPSGGDVVWTWRSWDHLVQDSNRLARGYGEPEKHAGRIDINADHRFLPARESEEERLQREELEKQMRALGYAGGGKEDKPDGDGKAGQGEPGSPRIDADWLHTNSIDLLPELDLIVLSTPKMNEIWVIDHSTTTEQAAGAAGGRWGHGGDLLYRWGAPRSYGLGDPASRQLFAQHHATWQQGSRPGELRVLLFNNGPRRPEGEHSSVEELALPFDPERGFLRESGRPFGPAAPAWSYSDPGRFYSAFISGAERLGNGNTLICEGAKGRVFEVTPEGRVVWDFWSPLGGEIPPSPQGGKAPPKALFRAARIAKDHPGLAGRI